MSSRFSPPTDIILYGHIRPGDTFVVPSGTRVFVADRRYTTIVRPSSQAPSSRYNGSRYNRSTPSSGYLSSCPVTTYTSRFPRAPAGRRPERTSIPSTRNGDNEPVPSGGPGENIQRWVNALPSDCGSVDGRFEGSFGEGSVEEEDEYESTDPGRPTGGSSHGSGNQPPHSRGSGAQWQPSFPSNWMPPSGRPGLSRLEQLGIRRPP
jgi:hypothetical protein